MRVSLTQVRSVTLPLAVARETHAHLAAVGRRGLEGIALWAGAQDEEAFAIRRVIVPNQQGIRNEHGVAVVVESAELHRINLDLYRSGDRLLAQIHSHPTHAFHSDMDDEYAIATALGSFSIVVPDFATGPFAFERFATYRLAARPCWSPGDRPRWTAVAARDAARVFVLVEG